LATPSPKRGPGRAHPWTHPPTPPTSCSSHPYRLALSSHLNPLCPDPPPPLAAGAFSDLCSTPYSRALQALLHGLRQALPPGDAALVQLLLEAPALPLPQVTAHLRGLADEGGEWAAAAMRAARWVCRAAGQLRCACGHLRCAC
jgi:hypothetical protein